MVKCQTLVANLLLLYLYTLVLRASRTLSDCDLNNNEYANFSAIYYYLFILILNIN